MLGVTFHVVVAEDFSQRMALTLCLNERRSQVRADLGDDSPGRGNQQCKGPVAGRNLVIQESEGRQEGWNQERGRKGR